MNWQELEVIGEAEAREAVEEIVSALGLTEAGFGSEIIEAIAYAYALGVQHTY